MMQFKVHNRILENVKDVCKYMLQIKKKIGIVTVNHIHCESFPIFTGKNSLPSEPQTEQLPQEPGFADTN
jgi:hypothetical protein